MKTAEKMLTKTEARFLVDSYYTIQDYRKTAASQIRAATPEHEQPSEVLTAFLGEYEQLENKIKKELDRFSDSLPIGRQMRRIVGIGPVIAAGLLAHIDIERAPTVGHLWSFAGLNPEAVWEKGQKRPWNARLRTLSWLIGESFVKVSGNERDVYGHLWLERRKLEWEKNLAGVYADKAEEAMKRHKIGTDTEAYQWYTGQYCVPYGTIYNTYGEYPFIIKNKPEKHLPKIDAIGYKLGKMPAVKMLPPGHIHARAKRYAAKMFLSHLWQAMYQEHYGIAPPLPYAIAQLEHVNIIPLPEAFQAIAGEKNQPRRASQVQRVKP